MYCFGGKWITNGRFIDKSPVNVFHRQLERVESNKEELNSHILFRKSFSILKSPREAFVYVSADDYFKLYINGKFVGMGPAPDFHFNYGYNKFNVKGYLKKGNNTIAVHTFYQGLNNRVWQSGDLRHGLILDLVSDGKTLVKSDESFFTKEHDGYTFDRLFGYSTQFNENFDFNSKNTEFYKEDFDDSSWENALVKEKDDHVITHENRNLVFEKIKPVSIVKNGKKTLVDFGEIFVGYPCVRIKGKKGQAVIVKEAQELEIDGSIKNDMRCNCDYTEKWILSGRIDKSDRFDYRSFRYLQIESEEAEVKDVYLLARHYPFTLNATVKKEYKNDELIKRIWKLCVDSQKYGVQEVIQDCMEREKGFYLGDGCYSALANLILTKDDSMTRKLIDDSFKTSFICESLMSCADCSCMQEIAEYPLIMVDLIWWHYNLVKDKKYLEQNYYKAVKVLDCYKKEYEKDNILSNLDKWCVVEWPKNYQDGYAVDIEEGKVCKEAHVSINAYYIESIKTMNKIAKEIGLPKYRDVSLLEERFYKAFYDSKNHVFYDGVEHRHVSYVGNVFPFAFGLIPDDEYKLNFINTVKERGMSSLAAYCTFPLLCGLIKEGYEYLIKDLLKEEGAYKRMLNEGATRTFECWGKDAKWNTSLFHLTLTYATVFIADVDLKNMLR